jgi:hypothetical protein
VLIAKAPALRAAPNYAAVHSARSRRYGRQCCSGVTAFTADDQARLAAEDAVIGALLADTKSHSATR